MGLFRKIKDIFYDEEIIEVPNEEEKSVVRKEPEEREIVTRETIREEKPNIEEITAPINTIDKYKTVDEEDEEPVSYSERELFKPEKTFDFPVFEEEEEEIKTRSRTNVLELQKELEQRSMVSKAREAEKPVVSREPEKSISTFKPSPVISPVYGILDKNYKKDEIIEKKNDNTSNVSQKEINYDYVRRKAYGTLEDELEDTLTKVNTEIVESVNELEKEINELPKPSDNIQDLLGQIKKNATIGELEEQAKEEMLEKDEEESEEEEKVSDNTLEHDLFNLIDSMYENKEE